MLNRLSRMRYRGASRKARCDVQMNINVERHRLARGRDARVRLLVCGLALLLAPPGARAGQDGIVANPYEGDPAARRAGAALYGTRCAECHGADAKGISGPDLTALWAVGTSEARVFQTIRRGVPDSIMPSSSAPDNELWAIVAYLKSVSTVSPVEFATGDADHGREIFRSTCARCHRVNGIGGRLGPDLSRIARIRSRASLTQAVRDPSASMAVGYRTVTLVTTDGGQIRGVKKGEDAFSVQIVDTGERLQGYLKADLGEVRDEEQSLMPAFGPDRLSDGDLDDLLRFLGTLNVDQ